MCLLLAFFIYYREIQIIGKMHTLLINTFTSYDKYDVVCTFSSASVNE